MIIEKTVYLTKRITAEGKPEIDCYDFAPYPADAYLASRTIQFEVDQRAIDDTDACLVDELRKRKTELQAKHEAEVQQIEATIQELLALPAPSEEMEGYP